MFLPVVHQITPLLERGLPLSAYADPTARHTTYIPDRDVYDLSHPLPLLDNVRSGFRTLHRPNL
jgi:hypothetical protein